MSIATDYLENKIIDHMLRNQAFTPPPAVYLALFTSATDDTGGGTEVTGGSYARQAVTLSAASGGATSNSTAETFPSMPACTVTHWALFDAATSGNMLVHGTVTTPKTYSAGEDATVDIGALDVAVA